MKSLDVPVYAFYLDEEMVLNFVASTQDGAVMLEKVSRLSGDEVSKTEKGSGSGGVDLKVLAHVNASGELSKEDRASD